MARDPCGMVAPSGRPGTGGTLGYPRGRGLGPWETLGLGRAGQPIHRAETEDRWNRAWDRMGPAWDRMWTGIDACSRDPCRYPHDRRAQGARIETRSGDDGRSRRRPWNRAPTPRKPTARKADPNAQHTDFPSLVIEGNRRAASGLGLRPEPSSDRDAGRCTIRGSVSFPVGSSGGNRSRWNQVPAHGSTGVPCRGSSGAPVTESWAGAHGRPPRRDDHDEKGPGRASKSGSPRRTHRSPGPRTAPCRRETGDQARLEVTEDPACPRENPQDAASNPRSSPSRGPTGMGPPG